MKPGEDPRCLCCNYPVPAHVPAGYMLISTEAFYALRAGWEAWRDELLNPGAVMRMENFMMCDGGPDDTLAYRTIRVALGLGE